MTLKFFYAEKLLLLNGTLIFEKFAKYNGLILRCKVLPCTIRRNGLVKNMQAVQQWHNFDVECSRMYRDWALLWGTIARKNLHSFVI